MTRPKVVVFDLGKVLVDFDYAIAARRIAERSTVQPATVQGLIEQSPLLCRFETGRLTAEEFFAEVRGTTGFTGSFEEFAGFFADIFTPIEPMVMLNRTLRKNGIRTFIFSNTNSLAAEHIRRRFPFFADFDDYILSYEEGVMKPESALYEVVERRTGHRGAEILYLDDRAENVAAGESREWRVIMQQDPDQTIRRVREWGVLT